MSLGKNIKYLRNKNSITQLTLGEILAVSQTTIGDYENGKTEPNIFRVIKIADYFSVSIDGLLRQDMAVEGVSVVNGKSGNNIHQVNANGDNHAVFNHTESEWAGMEQRVKDLEANIESQKQTIAAYVRKLTV